MNWLQLISVALRALGLADALKRHWDLEEAKEMQGLKDENARLKTDLAGALAALAVAPESADSRLHDQTF